jgi:hypothetical protein
VLAVAVSLSLLAPVAGQPAVASYLRPDLSVAPAPDVRWGAPREVGPQNAWTWRPALASTHIGATWYLHTVYFDQARSSGGTLSNGGVLEYIRSSNGGRSWTTPVRLARLSDWTAAGIASSGSHVYAAWWTDDGASSVLYFRSNARHGAGPWRPILRLSPATIRVNDPRMAAAGDDVYISYTDYDTGAIWVTISRDNGATWRTSWVGWTPLKTDSGMFESDAVIAASGAAVAVAWVSDLVGSLTTRGSSDHGATWDIPAIVGSLPYVGPTWDIPSCSGLCSSVSIAMSGSRTAIAWEGQGSVAVRVRVGSTWEPQRNVAGAFFTPDVALSSSSRVGVAFMNADYADFTSDIVWQESADNGQTWAAPQTLSHLYPENSNPSVLWLSASIRYVHFDWSHQEAGSGMHLMTGIGLP